MKKIIKIGIIVTGIIVSSAVIAKDDMSMGQGNKNMMGDPAQMEKMMDQRMAMMKSELKLDSKQARAFDAFAKQKKSMMKDMMKKKQARMKDMQGSQGNMQGGMGNMQGNQGNMHGGMGNMKGDMGNMKGGMGNMKGDMGNMQGQKGMAGCKKGMGMMSMMSSMSFEERINMMQKHAEKMQATAKAGKDFYKTLNATQKKKLNDMPKNTKGMNMGQK